MKTNKDRIRPFLLQPIYHGAPASWSMEYFRGRLKVFREENPDFNVFLKEVEQEINDRKLSFCGNILSFLQCEAKPNWVCTKKSLLHMFVKLYNYDFSASQTVDYIGKCHNAYTYLFNTKLKISNEYSISTINTRWDFSARDCLEITLSPIIEPKDLDDSFFIRVTLCSLTERDTDVDYQSDTKVELAADKDIYKDALCLFDCYQGNRFLNKTLKFTIDSLIKYGVIRKVEHLEWVDCYKFKKPHSYRIEIPKRS